MTSNVEHEVAEVAAGEHPDLGRRGGAALLGITALSIGLVYLIRPVAAYKALALGAGTLELGLLTVSFAGLPVVLALVIGRQVDRRGATALMMAGSVALVLAVIGVKLATDFWLLLPALALLGVGQLGTAVAGQALAAGKVERGRDQRLGYFTLAVSFGQLGGALGMAATAPTVARPTPQELEDPIALALGAALVAVAVCLTLPRARQTFARAEERQLQLTVRAILAGSGVRSMLMTTTLVLTAIDLLIIYLPALAAEAGVGAHTVGMALAVRAASSAAPRLFLGRLVGALSREIAIAAGTLIGAFAFLALAFTRDEHGLFAVMAAMGVGLGIVPPLTIAWMSSQFSGEHRGAALSVRIASSRLGQLVAPPVAGVVGAIWGIGALFGGVAILLGAAVTLAVVSLRPGSGAFAGARYLWPR